MYCSQCGQENDQNNYKCNNCGTILHQDSNQPRYVNTAASGSSVIPMKNPMALAAYYLGIFSLIPCIGIALGFFALLSGIGGYLQYRSNPEIKGKVHAWVGIVLGTLTFLGNLLLIGLPLLFEIMRG